jgi:hypothetical protein
MREIQLTRGMVAMVDDEDYEMLSHWRWYFNSRGYAQACNGGDRYHRRLTSMHRVVALPDPTQEVDHINGDKLDNRRSNLRPCSRSENQRNNQSHVGTSRFKGVSWQSSKRKWKAQIDAKDRYKGGYIGNFDDEVSAALAYDAAARECFGVFARLNFPQTN